MVTAPARQTEPHTVAPLEPELTSMTPENRFPFVETASIAKAVQNEATVVALPLMVAVVPQPAVGESALFSVTV